jgi:hypothetical protein
MFSYRAGLLQTRAAKRAENRFNGAGASSSGEDLPAAEEFSSPSDLAGPPGFAFAGQPRRLSLPAFAPLMSTINILRWTLARTSFIVKSLRKPALQPVSRSCFLHASLDAVVQIS